MTTAQAAAKGGKRTSDAKKPAGRVAQAAGRAPAKPAPGRAARPAARPAAAAKPAAQRKPRPAAPAPQAAQDDGLGDLKLDEELAPFGEQPGGEPTNVDPLADSETDPQASDIEGQQTFEEQPQEPEEGGDAQGAAGSTEDPAPEGGENQYQYSAGFEVCDVPVEGLKLNKIRTPTEDSVARMVKLIKAIGLQYPIVVGRDKGVIDGNTRVLAYKAMGKKTIPAMIAFDHGAKFGKGEAPPKLASKDSVSVFQGLASNLGRDDMTEIERAKAFKKCLDDGLAASAKELAQHIGLPASTVSRALSVLEKGTKAVRDAVEARTISAGAAHAIVSKTESPAEQESLLANLIACNEGKVSRAAVQKATSGRAASTGRKPSRAPIANEALASDETGISGIVQKNVAKDIEVILTVHLPLKAENFTRYDLVRQLQAQLAKLDAGKVRAELENVRKRLVG